LQSFVDSIMTIWSFQCSWHNSTR